MRFLYTILLWTVSVYFIYGLYGHASAQDSVLLEAPKLLGDIRSIAREPDIESLRPVSERTPPSLRPVPIHWRGFKIYPLIETTQTVDSNIFTTGQNEEADTYTTLSPSIFFNKEYGRHEAGLSLNAEAKKYWSNNDEDVINFNTKFNALLEARRELKIPIELFYTSSHEARGQNLLPNFSKEPIAFNAYGAALGLSYEPNRLGASAILRYSDLSFDNGERLNGQTLIRTDGDRSLTALELITSYQILPNHRPYISMNFSKIDYKRGIFDGRGFNGFERDSKNFDAAAGWQLNYKGLIEADIELGYGSKDYESAAIEDVNGTQFNTRLSWNVTKKATLNLNLKRNITEDNQVTQGIILNRGRVQLDYEVLHSIYYKAYLDYALADFQSTTREDDILSMGTGLEYLINPRWSVSGDYRYKQRNSTAAGLDYDRHQFMVRLNTRL